MERLWAQWMAIVIKGLYPKVVRGRSVFLLD